MRAHSIDVSSSGRVRRLSLGDLPLVLAWRNHPAVRRHMLRTTPITDAEHASWFAGTDGDPHTHLLIFEKDGASLGYAKILQLDGGPVADWGFYAAPEAPKGTGTLLGKAVLHYAFSVVGVHRVCAQVLESNQHSLRFHEKMGFSREGLLRDHHFDGTIFQSVVCLGLLAHEWERADS